MTRKYCVRCGSSLIKSAESDESKTAEAPIEKEVAPPTATETQQVSKAEEVSHVRPSEVATDRVRMAERHAEKTELEKAQEAFARSEATDERMLRASEIRELQSEVDREPERPPLTTGPASPQASHIQPSEPAPTPATPEKDSTQVEYDEGKEVVKQILQRVKEAESRAKGSAEAEPPAASATIEKPPSAPAPSAPSVDLEPEASPKTEPVEVGHVSAEPKPAPVEPSTAEPVTSVKPTPDLTIDQKVRQIDTDIKTLTIEKEQLRNELATLQNRLDEDVEQLRIAAETKRTQAEAAEREYRLAKKDYEDAKKEFKKGEKRRKKEISDAEKRIKNTEKKMKKARNAREKRVREIEKERLKREAES